MSEQLNLTINLADKQLTIEDIINTIEQNNGNLVLNPLYDEPKLDVSPSQIKSLLLENSDTKVLNDELFNFLSNLKNNKKSDVPSGTIITFASITPPDGYLICDGDQINRIEYNDLFNVIGVTYGAGDGVETFNLPDLRGEFIRGYDHNRGIDSNRDFGSFQEDMLKSHKHDSPHWVRLRGSGAYGLSGAGSSWQDGNFRLGDLFSNFGGHETRPRNIALNHCIKY